MKNKFKITVFLFIHISVLCSFIFAENTELDNDKAWHLLELGKLQLEKGEFGKAMGYANKARELHKMQIQKKYKYMFNALKPKQVKYVGDNILNVYEVLKKREDYDACAILDEIFLTHPPIFFEKSISRLMDWLEKKDAFPETDYLTGLIYSAEGEYTQAIHYYKTAWDYRRFLEIPDARFNIIYALADTSRLLRRYDDCEKYLLLVLTEDPVYGTTNLESPTLQAMIRTITSENDVEKFLLLYRHHNPIALKAYMDLTDIYMESRNYKRALTVAALAANIAITNLDESLSKTDYNYSYTAMSDLFYRIERKQEILEWANAQNFWKAIMNLADVLAASRNTKQALDLYQKISASVPALKYAQEASFKKRNLEKQAATPQTETEELEETESKAVNQ